MYLLIFYNKLSELGKYFTILALGKNYYSSLHYKF